ncbi:two-component system, NtrC family, sensor kinase [Gallionellaceae bacterium]|nr:two-component system, NtrC family, sensor kinase [Gallionellaceae bacterium]
MTRYSSTLILSRMRRWVGQAIARKLLLAFFSVFIVTYLITALVVQNAVRTALTNSELGTLSQVAHLRLGSIRASFDELSVDLRAWAKLDVMNDLVSGDVDKRVESALENLKKDYAIEGEIHTFNAEGKLIASSSRQQGGALLPDAWKPGTGVRFVDKHSNPLGGGDIVALSLPVVSTFSAGYQLGTLVLAYPWAEVQNRLADQALLLDHRDSSGLVSSDMPQPSESRADSAHSDSIVLLGSTLHFPVPDAALRDLAHKEGWLKIGDKHYLFSSAHEDSGLLSGWQVVVLREPDTLNQTINSVALKLAALCAILALPLTLAISWLASRLTAPLRELTQFVTSITETQDLSKRLTLHSNDELGVLADAFNQMTEKLESASKDQELLVHELKRFAEELENKVAERTRDLTKSNFELIRTLENLKAAQSQLIHQEKMASLGQLVAGVAHELNNPIGFIYANFPHLEEYVLELLNLLDELRRLPVPVEIQKRMDVLYADTDLEFLREDLLRIIKSGKSGAERVREIVASLRSFSHLGEAELKLARLENGLDDTLALLKHQLKTRNIKVERDYHLGVPVLCRPGQLNQVFMNILSNAVQASNEDGVITIRTGREDDWVVVRISDTGCGMPPEVMNHIFDPFYTTKPVGEGTGLGLSISHGIIENHGGKIGVESAVGQGTTFTLRIPFKQ